MLANQRDPKVAGDGWRHFYFHRAGTSYEEALADLTDCYRFTELSKSWIGTPTYAPWTERPRPVTEAPPPMYTGILPSLIGAALIKTQNRRATQSRLRRCMEPRGYQRYPLSEDDWKWLIADFSPTTLPLQAKYASGPAPDAEPVPTNK